MSGSLNKVCLIGNLGKDPEIRSTQDGREIANLSLATSESWKNKSTGERMERTEWHRVVIFNEGLVRVTKDYLKKGSKVYLEGQLQTRKWTDKDGQDKYSTEVVLQNFGSTLTMLSRVDRSDDAEDEPAAPAPRHTAQSSELLDDEIPFAYLIACAASGLMLMLQYGQVMYS